MLSFKGKYKNSMQVLEEYRRWVLAQSKANLSKKKKNASGDLKKSLKGYINRRFNRDSGGKFISGRQLPGLRFEYNYYGEFIDKGVKGSKETYIKSMNSPYKFRNNKGSVPVKPIKEWLAKRGKDQKLAYAVARSIYRKGIEATKFFSAPFNKRYRSFVHKYHVAIADDIADDIAKQLKKKFKKEYK